jgi:hypothetical protein
MTQPYIKTLQFIDLKGGLGSGGKKHMTKASSKKRTDTMLMANPNLPRLKRRFSNGSLRHRFRQTQEMDTM